MISEIAAGIVTYNPDLNKLKATVYKLTDKVGRIYIVDNASENISEIKDFCDISRRVALIENDSNKGIATALNQIMTAADEDDFNWVLLLDDDSKISDNLIEGLYEGTGFKDIGIVCPRIRDINSGEFIKNKGEKNDEARAIIKKLTDKYPLD